MKFSYIILGVCLNVSNKILFIFVSAREFFKCFLGEDELTFDFKWLRWACLQNVFSKKTILKNITMLILNFSEKTMAIKVYSECNNEVF